MIYFNYETDKYKTVKKIRFKTGETLILKYTRVFGLVADLEEDHSTSIGLDSKEYPIIRKRSIPISFVTCNKFKPKSVIRNSALHNVQINIRSL